MMNKITGISSGFHDAALSTIDDDGNILFAGHSERYSRIKNDPRLGPYMLIEGTTVFYEKPFRKNLRRLYAGQGWVPKPAYDHYVKHHWSHAAAAYYTRPYPEEPVCVVIDAIGEWDTCSIWYKKKKVWSKRYPWSLGLFYSAMTQHIGLKPMEDEYITMGMAAFAWPHHSQDLSRLLKYNLHMGLPENPGPMSVDKYQVALDAQRTLEKHIIKIMEIARIYSNCLCYGGGVALNCVANTKIHPMFDKVWIFPNPGDAGSSLGAAAAYLNKPLQFTDVYLGHDIQSHINPKEVAQYLHTKGVCGVAHGKAEFGPRALGNRSLLADPRKDIKDTVNDIKRRQRFRPFAPVILSEYAYKYFDGPMNEYMQYVATAKHDYKSVTHVDGTARVQIVKPDSKSIIRQILEEWYEITGCPMLLNTSLNIKGQPIVNTKIDAKAFEIKYGVKVF
jgi:carbamoyltransferase